MEEENTGNSVSLLLLSLPLSSCFTLIPCAAAVLSPLVALLSLRMSACVYWNPRNVCTRGLLSDCLQTRCLSHQQRSGREREDVD